MQMSDSPLRTVAGIILGLLLIVGASLLIIRQSTHPIPLPSSSPSTSPKISTFSGTLACLPHKDTKGPQTLECAYGLKMADAYYAIDTTFFPVNIASIPIGEKVIITGDLTPIESMPNASLEKYDIQGTIRLSDIERIK
ncbi:MAG TPA: hypothetical protein VGE59_01135 [Patescibacteria group bacterium]